MKIRILSLLLFSLVFISCSTVLKTTTIQPKSKTYKNYEIGKNYIVSVGDPIFEFRNDKIIPSFEVIYDYKPPGLGLGEICSMPIMKKGMIFKAICFIPENSSFIIQNDNYANESNCSADPYDKSICLNVDNKGKVINGWISAKGRVATLQGSDWKEDFLKSNLEGEIQIGSFKGEIIYSGLQGNTIKALYREYFDNYIRPAFQQELQWDISGSKAISYKSIKAEVIKATSTNLEIKVISDENLNWLPK